MQVPGCVNYRDGNPVGECILLGKINRLNMWVIISFLNDLTRLSISKKLTIGSFKTTDLILNVMNV